MTNLYTAHITTQCRQGRGDTGAFDEAVARLREVYEIQLQRFPNRTLHLAIARQDPLDPDEFDAAEKVRREAA